MSRILSLTLRNFRNITDCTVKPEPGLNFFLGSNGQGKTTFLEALGYLATLRSFRGSKTSEVIQWGAGKAEILAEIAPEDEAYRDLRTELKISFSLREPGLDRATQIAFINGKPYRSSTQYLSSRFGQYELGFHAVVFNPADHDLVRGEPAVRRSYLDRVLAAEDEEYLKVLQKYHRVLKQRNALLKSLERPAPELLMGFTEPLASYGASLTAKRLEWIRRLSERLNVLMHHIAPKQPDLRFIYLSGWMPPIEGLSFINNDLTRIHFAGQEPLPSLELLEQAFWKKESSMEAAEWKSGHSLVGPHRDDWMFYLGSQALKGHGSQGEVRSALLALKLAEIELFRDATGHQPVFLLDDFSSELDQERRNFLMGSLKAGKLQVFVTSTDERLSAGDHYRVKEGFAWKLQQEEPSLHESENG